MASTTTASLSGRRAPWWQAASWIGLILLGAFNIYAAAADLAATAGTGLPSDHAGTFTALSGRTWASFKAAQPGAAHYSVVHDEETVAEHRDPSGGSGHCGCRHCAAALRPAHGQPGGSDGRSRHRLATTAIPPLRAAGRRPRVFTP